MIGFRILPRRRKVDGAFVMQFRGLPVANVSDCMHRMSAGGPRLRPMHGSGGMVGTAFTVRTRPGDNLMVHKALDLAEPGDVVVVDAGGDLTNAILGEIMTGHAKRRGLAGLVIHGAIRDVDAIRAGTFPVFALGVTHRGPYKDGPGEINVPVALEGMVVEPGDLVLGDGDGVLCVPHDAVAGVLALAQAKQATEAHEIRAVAEGALDRRWVDARLAELGCEGVEQDRK
jgi:RraA family protein